MHLALIGCSSAGKTTLARAIVRACQERGIPASLSEDFAMRRLRLGWIRNRFVRRRILLLWSLGWLLVTWRQHGEFYALMRRVIGTAPGGWTYRLTLVRLTIRKLGIHALIDGGGPSDQVIVSDNEAVLQAAHHLFVHPGREGAGPLDSTAAALLAEFAVLSPRPDSVVYLRAPADVLIDRMLRRGHRRLGATSRRRVTQFVDRAVETFERLGVSPALESHLFIVDQKGDTLSVEPTANDATWPSEVEPFLSAAVEELNARAWVHDPHDVVDSKILHALMTRLNGDVRYTCLDNGYAEPRSSDPSHCLRLLVAEPDLSRAMAILAELGFKESVVGEGSGSSASRAHFALDHDSGQLICVRVVTQAWFQIGRRRGCRLPIERMLLSESRQRGTTRAPSDAAALLLFVLGVIVELGSWGGVKEWATKRERVRQELRWLAMRCSTHEALALLDTHCGWMGEVLFLECLNALFEGRSLPRLLRLSLRVRRALRISVEAEWLGGSPSLVARLATGGTSGASDQAGRTLPSGGVLIAFVGPDATGKSTLAADLARCLRPCVEVKEVHLGKPPGTLWTHGLNGVLKLLRAVRGRQPRWKPKSLPALDGGNAGRVGPAALLYAVRAVSVAFDRRHAVLEAVRASERGTVVVCDRYPSQVVGAMDGPRLGASAPGDGAVAGLYAMLARWEHRLYDELPAPDLLVKLRVSLKEARRRNRERSKSDKHTEEDLEKLHRLLGATWPASGERILEIDTGGSLEESILAVRTAVWTGLDEARVGTRRLVGPAPDFGANGRPARWHSSVAPPLALRSGTDEDIRMTETTST